MNKRIVRDALILTAFTLVLGLVLGFVYNLTKEPIAAAELAAAQAAYQQVFEDADHFAAYEEFDAAEVEQLMADLEFEDEINDVQVAYDSSENILGYVITVTAKDASQDNITFSVGIQNDGTVNGYSITKIAETPGLGMKVLDEEFMAAFQNKLVDQFLVVKAEPVNESEIEAISGATITTDAVANGVNACIAYFQNILTGGN
ncbi:MAG: RnfABCDGE type electron transport complex subunit G [Lachnospiraceae bacterium]